MLLRLAIVLLVAALPVAAGARVHLRLTPEVSAGGGWASSLYLGSEEGARYQLRLSPGLAVDVSTGPLLKLLSSYRYGFSRFGAGESGQSHDAELVARFRLGRAWDAELAGAASRYDFTEPVGTEPSGPAASVATFGAAGPRLRFRAGASTTLELSYEAGRRSSEADGEADVLETSHDVELLVLRDLGPRLAAGARVRGIVNGSSEPGYAYTGAGGSLFVSAAPPLGELLVRLFASAQWNSFREGASHLDRWASAGVSASHPLHAAVRAEVAWSYARNDVLAGGDDASPFEGDRHLTWLGVRAELPWWL